MGGNGGGGGGGGGGVKFHEGHKGGGAVMVPAALPERRDFSLKEILDGRRLRSHNEPREVAMQARLAEVKDTLQTSLRELKMLYQTKYIMRDAISTVDDVMAHDNQFELSVDPLPDIRGILLQSSNQFAAFLAEVSYDVPRMETAKDPFDRAQIYSVTLRSIEAAFGRVRHQNFLAEEIIRKLYAKADALAKENTELKGLLQQGSAAAHSYPSQQHHSQQQQNEPGSSGGAPGTPRSSGGGPASPAPAPASLHPDQANAKGTDGGGPEIAEKYEPIDVGSALPTEVVPLQEQLLNARKEIKALRLRVRALELERTNIQELGLETWASYTPHLLQKADQQDIELVSQLKTKLESAKFMIRSLTSRNEALSEQVEDLRLSAKTDESSFHEAMREYVVMRDLQIHRLHDTIQSVVSQLFGERDKIEAIKEGELLSPHILAMTLLAKRNRDFSDDLKGKMKSLEAVSAPEGGNATRALYGVDMDNRSLVQRFNAVSADLPQAAKRELMGLFSEIHFRFHLLQKEKNAVSKGTRELRAGSSQRVQQLLVERSIMKDALESLWRKHGAEGGALLLEEEAGGAPAIRGLKNSGSSTNLHSSAMTESVNNRIFSLISSTSEPQHPPGADLMYTGGKPKAGAGGAGGVSEDDRTDLYNIKPVVETRPAPPASTAHNNHHHHQQQQHHHHQQQQSATQQPPAQQPPALPPAPILPPPPVRHQNTAQPHPPPLAPPPPTTTTTTTTSSWGKDDDEAYGRPPK